MNSLFTHSINNRTLTTYNSIEKELELLPDKNYLFDLSYLSVLDVSGDKAIEFLQGQVTCDVQSLTDIQMVQGAQCNLQGRILTLMDILNWQGIKLVLPSDLMDPTIKSLTKTAMLSRVSLGNNSDLCILGFYFQNANDLIPDANFFADTLHTLTQGTYSCWYHLGNHFYIFIAPAEFAKKLSQLFAEKNQLRGSLTWHTLRLKQQEITIYPETRGLFLPHRLDLQKTPYLSFNKGCYKGQEIIARMHYKATIKHHMQPGTILTHENIYSGQKLFSGSTHTEVGELIDFSPLDSNPNTKHYLVVVSILKDFNESVLFDGHNQSIELNTVTKGVT